MKNKMVSILLALTMASAVFTGCGQEQEVQDSVQNSVQNSVESSEGSTEAEDSQPEQAEDSGRISEETITITVEGRTMNSENDWNASEQFKQYEEHLGLKLKATAYTVDQWASKLTLMLASDEMPDIIANAGLSSEQVKEYGEDGYFLDFSEYLDIMPNFVAFMEKYPEYAAVLKDDEGHIYALSQLNESPDNYLFYSTYINQTWLNNLGLEKPKSLDDLYNVLVAFRDEDADGDGDPNNEYPLGYQASSWYHVEYPILWGHGIYVACTDGGYHMMIDENNQVILGNATENYKDFLKYMHKLYDEELMNQDAYVISSDELLQRFADMKIGTMMTARSLPSLRSGDYAVDNLHINNTWTILGGYSDETYSPEGKIVLYGRVANGGNWAVNADTEYPEEICKFFDYLFTDEGALGATGLFEGVTMDFKDFFGAKVTANNDYLSKYPTGQFSNSTAAINAFIVRSTQKFSTLGALEYVSDEDLNSNECKIEAGQHLLKEKAIREYEGNVLNGYPVLSYTSEELKELATLKTDLKNYMASMKSQFIVGEKDIDATWDEYLAELEKIGLSRLLEIEQAAYDRYIAK